MDVKQNTLQSNLYRDCNNPISLIMESYKFFFVRGSFDQMISFEHVRRCNFLKRLWLAETALLYEVGSWKSQRGPTNHWGFLLRICCITLL